MLIPSRFVYMCIAGFLVVYDFLVRLHFNEERVLRIHKSFLGSVSESK